MSTRDFNIDGAGDAEMPDACARCGRLLPEGYCFDCEREELEIGGWDGSLSFGARRVNHVPED